MISQQKYRGNERDKVILKEIVPGVESSQTAKKEAFGKIRMTCSFALTEYNLKYACIDTCCIDKSSSAELSEAINSIFRWVLATTDLLLPSKFWDAKMPALAISLLASLNGSTLQSCRTMYSGQFAKCYSYHDDYHDYQAINPNARNWTAGFMLQHTRRPWDEADFNFEVDHECDLTRLTTYWGNKRMLKFRLCVSL
ncbi:hypothetical protein BKA64DRAFT_646199 [Cadophora sp. MPI-SDFR-AT-0126]|nr:hypothetical protein BKA64DRAFT_646199 [Leotiomycetes sp. MPI-SDFR-AT-0126]